MIAVLSLLKRLSCINTVDISIISNSLLHKLLFEPNIFNLTIVNSSS